MHEHSGIVIPVRGQIMLGLSIGGVDGKIKPLQAGKTRLASASGVRLRD